MIAHANGINIYYEKCGTGKPLILLHGNGETHTIFDEAVKILSKHFTVYTPDSRGHGKSDKITSFHYSDFAEDIKFFIDNLDIKKPILYGFSDGGITCLLLAIKYPDILSRLIISGANTVPQGLKSIHLIYYKLLYIFKRDPLLKLMLTEPHITSEELSKIKISVSVLAGSRDMIKIKHTKYIAKMIQNSTLTILNGETHGSYIVHSTKIAELILKITKIK